MLCVQGTEDCPKYRGLKRQLSSLQEKLLKKRYSLFNPGCSGWEPSAPQLDRYPCHQRRRFPLPGEGTTTRRHSPRPGPARALLVWHGTARHGMARHAGETRLYGARRGDVRQEYSSSAVCAACPVGRGRLSPPGAAVSWGALAEGPAGSRLKRWTFLLQLQGFHPSFYLPVLFSGKQNFSGFSLS